MVKIYAEKTQEILKGLLSSNIEASAFISRDGVMIESVKTNGIPDDEISTLSAAILSIGLRTCQTIGKGNLEGIIIKTSDGHIIIKEINKENLLTVLASSISELDELFIYINKASQNLMEVYS